ncbi:MAG: TrmH family RNA methyltransferase [Bacilli bacterium]
MNDNYQLNHEEYFHERKKFPIYLILDNVTDPVNIGSIFRLADALGVSKVFLCGINNELMNNKKIKRVSRNTMSYVDYYIYPTTVDCIKAIKNDNLKIIALEITSKSLSINTYCFEKNIKYAFVIGNEEHGVSQDVLDIVDESLHIDMYGNNSSMNVSVATGIAVNQCLNKIK